MNVFRRTAADFLTEPAVRSAADPSRPRIYDPFSLAVRPLPADLRLHPHPREITVEAAQRITGGIFG